MTTVKREALYDLTQSALQISKTKVLSNQPRMHEPNIYCICMGQKNNPVRMACLQYGFSEAVAGFRFRFYINFEMIHIANIGTNMEQKIK